MVRMVSSMIAAATAAFVALATQSADAYNFKCHGINYNIRAGPDWAPTETKCKPASQIKTELEQLKEVTDIVRIYSLTDCDQANAVVPVAIEAGLKVAIGLWVDSSPSSFEAEKAALETLVAKGDVITSDNIEYILVGSEALYRKDVNISTALSNFNEIKTLTSDLDITVTVADIIDIYTQYPSLVAAVDVLAINLFPFWELVDIDNAKTEFNTRYQAILKVAAAAGKETFISETGWASDGIDADASTATAANAAKYFYDIVSLAAENSWKYFYFAAYDEEWKIATLEANETVEAYFGIFETNGTLKSAIAELDFGSTSGSGSIEATESVHVTSVSGSSASVSVSDSESASSAADSESASADSASASTGSASTTSTSTDSTTASASTTSTSTDSTTTSAFTTSASTSTSTGSATTAASAVADATTTYSATQTATATSSSGKKTDCESGL